MTVRARRTFLLSVAGISLGAHLWGLTHDLPVPAPDERYFVRPAAYIAATGDPNPHWFGHPGSTVIYPLALLYRLREVVFHGAPLSGPAASVARRLAEDPASFYLMGRLLAVLCAVAAIPLVFAIARRPFDDSVAAVAAALWSLAPLAIEYGRITRTDAVGVLLAVTTVLLAVRLLERPSIRRAVAAGVGLGLAVSSRYFLACLGVVIAVAVLRSPAGRRVRLLASATGAAGATFAMTSPFVVLDPRGAWHSITAESQSPDTQRSGNVLTNLVFYAVHAIPSGVTVVVAAAAIAGLALALRRPEPATAMLLAWPAAMLVTISALPFHWDRWVLPALPAVVILAALGVVSAARQARHHLRSRQARPWLVAGLSGALVVGVFAAPATAVVGLDEQAADATTRGDAQRWIRHHLDPRAGVATEVNGPDLTETPFRTVEHHSLANAGTVADYATAGFRYVVVNLATARARVRSRTSDPQAAAFYGYLLEHTRRVATFRPTPDRSGAPLGVFDLRALAVAARARPAAGMTHPHVRQPRIRTGGAVPFDECILHRLAHQPHPARCPAAL